VKRNWVDKITRNGLRSLCLALISYLYSNEVLTDTQFMYLTQMLCASRPRDLIYHVTQIRGFRRLVASCIKILVQYTSSCWMRTRVYASFHCEESLKYSTMLFLVMLYITLDKLSCFITAGLHCALYCCQHKKSRIFSERISGLI